MALCILCDDIVDGLFSDCLLGLVDSNFIEEQISLFACA